MMATIRRVSSYSLVVFTAGFTALATFDAAARDIVEVPLANVILPQENSSLNADGQLELSDDSGHTACLSYQLDGAWYEVQHREFRTRSEPGEDSQRVRIYEGCGDQAGSTSLGNWVVKGDAEKNITVKPLALSQAGQRSPAQQAISLTFRSNDGKDRMYSTPFLALSGLSTSSRFISSYQASRRSFGVGIADASAWVVTPKWDTNAKFSLKVIPAENTISVSSAYFAQPGSSDHRRVDLFNKSIGGHIPKNISLASVQADTRITTTELGLKIYVNAATGLWVVDRDFNLIANGSIDNGASASRAAVWGQYLFVTTGSAGWMFDLFDFTLKKDKHYAVLNGRKLIQNGPGSTPHAPVILPSRHANQFRVFFAWTGSNSGEIHSVEFNPDAEGKAQPGSPLRVFPSPKGGVAAPVALPTSERAIGIADDNYFYIYDSASGTLSECGSLSGKRPVTTLFSARNGLVAWGNKDGKVQAVWVYEHDKCSGVVSSTTNTQLPGSGNNKAVPFDLLNEPNGRILVRSRTDGTMGQLLPVFEPTIITSGTTINEPTRLTACGLAMEANVSIGKSSRFTYAHSVCD